MQTVLNTSRLTLRALCDDDAARLAWLAGEYDVAGMCARLPHPYPLAAAFAFLTHLAAAREAKSEFAFALTAPIDGLIGACGVVRIGDETSRAWELGYWLGTPYWGMGYASEAAAAVMDWAREELAAETFVAAVLADNPRSAKVLRRLGFRPQGTQDLFSLARQRTSPGIRYVWPDDTDRAKGTIDGSRQPLH